MTMKPEDVSGLMNNRRTCHRFREAEIDEKILREAIELSLTAPNHKFTFPWKILVAGAETRQKVFDYALKRAEKKAADKGEDPAAVRQKIIEKVKNPSALVVFARKHNDDEKLAREDYATIACSIQNFTLSLLSYGYDAKWSTGSLAMSDESYKIFGVDRNTFEIEGYLWVGKPLVEFPPRRRPSYDDVVTHLS